MKIIIAGSREIQIIKPEHLKMISSMIKKGEMTELVSGMAPGVDYITYQFVKENHHIPIYECPADWYDTKVYPRLIKINALGVKYNVLAGYIRNQKMAEYADALIAFIKDESRGTKDMINRMKKLNKLVSVYVY